MRGSRYVAGWFMVAALAIAVAAGTLDLVRGAVGGTAVDALSQADISAAYSAARHTTTASPRPSGEPSVSSTQPGAGVPTPGASLTAKPSASRTSSPSAVPTHSVPSSHPPAPSRTPGPTVTPTPSPTASSTTRLLSSPGGSVVAQCTGSGDRGSVYLVSWSPAQGYFVDSVRRGPSPEAQVEFDSSAQSVSVTIHCTASGPVQTVETGSAWGGGGDD